MKSISIHKIEDKLFTLIQKKAKEKGLSLNKTIKMLLREALGLSSPAHQEQQHQFEQFCGVWDEQDLAEFNERVSDFEQIDPEDWK